MSRVFLGVLLAIIVQPIAGKAQPITPAAPVISGQLGLAVPLQDLLGSAAGLDAEFAEFAKLGAVWIRTDFWWDQIQRTAVSDYDWSRLDRMVAEASKYSMKVVAELHGCPAWVHRAGDMASPANVEAYGSFAAAAAKHFRGRVEEWEIWNEPNLRGSWCGRPDAGDYARALKAAYAAIKAVSPTNRVITGGLSPTPETRGDHIGAIDFLARIYAEGARGFFDAVGFHPYSWPLMPDDTAPWNGWQIMERGIRAVMVAHGDAARQIWITEFGAPTGGGRKAVSPQEQAEMLRRAIDLARATPWVGPLLWYSYRDQGGSRFDTENWYGLVGPNGERKPSHEIYQMRGAAN